MTDLGHVHRARGSDRCGLKSVEDQVSTDVRDVVQASESDLVARGIAIDLLQMAKRVGPQYEAAEYENFVRGGRSLLGQRRYGRLKEPSNLLRTTQWNSQ